MLVDIQLTSTGIILTHHIRRSGRKVFIFPYWDIPEKRQKNQAFTVPGHNSSSGTFSSLRKARGTYSKVYFSIKNITAPSHWPQYSPDEVLVHELAHSLRQVYGVERFASNGKNGLLLLPMASYENVEEFFAAMVASVYSSELGRPPLGNHGWWILPNPNVLGKPPFSTRLREFKERMPEFISDLAAIPSTVAPFNPFRDITSSTS